MFENLLKPSYWLTFEPPSLGGLSANMLFAFFAAVFILGIIVRIVSHHRTNDRFIQLAGERVSSLFVTMGLIGVALFFFGFEDIHLFGGKFWYPIWVFSFIAWAFFVLRFIRKDIPRLSQKELSAKHVDKYLPVRKKRKKRKR